MVLPITIITIPFRHYIIDFHCIVIYYTDFYYLQNRLYDQQCKTVSLFTIFKDIKREWILIVLGLIGSILVGASFPLFSLVIGEATQVQYTFFLLFTLKELLQ